MESQVGCSMQLFMKRNSFSQHAGNILVFGHRATQINKWKTMLKYFNCLPVTFESTQLLFLIKVYII